MTAKTFLEELEGKEVTMQSYVTKLGDSVNDCNAEVFYEKDVQQTLSKKKKEILDEIALKIGRFDGTEQGKLLKRELKQIIKKHLGKYE